MRNILLVIGLGLLLCITTQTSGQKKIKGLVTDKHSDEAIPFASVILKNGGEGTLTDSSGRFNLNYPGQEDSVLITSVGYKPLAFKVGNFTDSTFINIKMEVAPVSKDAVVKTKFNRALWFWNRIILHKKEHDISYYKNYSYEAYNKLEIDLNHVNAEKLSKNKFLKPFNFVLQNVDTSEKTPYLPVFLTETLSDFYLQHDPKIQKEIIHASNTNGIANESVTKLLGVMNQNVNVYHNFIPVFDKQFISPFHDNADNHYNYKLLDTQYLGNKRLVHLRFTPKRKGENTFEGDCWVADSSYAVQKITMRPGEEANVNFLQQLSLIQEYRLINDTTWFLAKDKFVADVSLLGKSTGSFKGRKTTTYRNVLFNSDSITQVLATNRKAEETIVLANSEERSRQFWDTSRHETLTKNEAGIYHMIDTIQSLPAFKKYSNAIMFLGSGYKNIGNFQIGPWQNWLSGNLQEGTRVRFDLGTNSGFSKKYYLHTFLAYGFGDKEFKGGADIFYLPKKHPRLYYYLSYFKDIDNGLRYYDEVTSDNIFSLAFVKPNIHPRYQMMQEKRFEIFKEFNSGLSILGAITSTQYDPVRNLPGISYFDKGLDGDPLNSFETSIRFRYAYLETFLENNLFRTSLGSDYPIVELKYAKGWSGFLKSSYNYHKVSLSVSDYVKLPPEGKVYYNVFAGKVFGTLPFSFLEIHPGNNMYYYNKYAFNLMNRFEFISDTYAGFNVEHNIGNGLFRYLPLTRKLKFRQFWQAKGLIGSLSDANQQLNNSSNEKFQTLNNKMYLEVGTGVDNILKFLRVDFIWRVLPQPLPKERVERFGIFGSFRLSF